MPDHAAPTGGLFLSTYIPWQLDRDLHGVYQRQQVMLQACVSAWGRVNVLLIDQGDHPHDASETAALIDWFKTKIYGAIEIQVQRVEKKRFSSGLAFFKSYLRPWPLPELESRSYDQLGDYLRPFCNSRIFCHRINSFSIINRVIKKDKLRLFLDLDDIEHIAWARNLKSSPFYPSKPLLHVHTLRYLHWERRALASCNHVFLCSEVDVRAFSRYKKSATLHAMQNTVGDPGARVDKLAPPQVRSMNLGVSKKPGPASVLFVGALGYSPNLIGLEWFIDKVWHKVLAFKPDARLVIAGKGHEMMKVPDDVSQTIDLLGFVDDLAPLYRAANVVICPLLSGGGTRIKLIESAAYCVPAVSTTVGAEGLSLTNNDSILLRDGSEDFAQALIDLLDDPERCASIGASARRVFELNYDRQAVIQKIAGVLMHD